MRSLLFATGPGWGPWVGADGTVVFLGTIGPSGEDERGRLFAWHPESGAAPLPLPDVAAGCASSVTSVAVSPSGDVGVVAGGVGSDPGCAASSVFLPGEGGGFAEALSLPMSPEAEDPDLVRDGARARALNDAGQLLLDTISGYSCVQPPCWFYARDELLLVDAAGLREIAIDDREVPGLPGETLLYSSSLIGQGAPAGPRPDAQVAWAGQFGTESDVRNALFAWDPATGLRIVALQGDVAPGTGAPFQNFWSVVWAGDALVFTAVLEPEEDLRTGVWVADPTGLRMLFEATPETGRVATLQASASGGHIAFASGASGMPPRLWTSQDLAAPVLRARATDVVPGLGGQIFSSFQLMHVSDDGALLLKRRVGTTTAVHYTRLPASGPAIDVATGSDERGDFLAFDAALRHFVVAGRAADGAIDVLAHATVPEPDAGLAGLAALGATLVLARPGRCRRAGTGSS